MVLRFLNLISSSNNTQIDGDTIFVIPSISKTFVTIILADMIKQGLVSLDDPIEKYLPIDNVTVPSYIGHKITLENLTTHTSGLPDSQWARFETTGIPLNRSTTLIQIQLYQMNPALKQFTLT
jgi:CubicO group peptidase (beta-lactamase class C family)